VGGIRAADGSPDHIVSDGQVVPALSDLFDYSGNVETRNNRAIGG